jgi:hypothetical protein
MYAIIRTYAMGVHVGEVVEKSETRVVLKNTRRIWYWDGACSLSQLALEGTKAPHNCKFSVELSLNEITSPNGLEIIPVSDQARESIALVKPWKK